MTDFSVVSVEDGVLVRRERKSAFPVPVYAEFDDQEDADRYVRLLKGDKETLHSCVTWRPPVT